ncbi:Crp/Fnr family transcriptional regulator [Desulfobacula sp.]|uniref:Crp/Fnr family transcriptional regulator n=1 Tax=Desulfobacula sp. TaxID=2593537 RepID=UPI0025B9ABA3|nr:cyclic nucleotide-binding domain-containing protein [Desulfobacula sp.]MBC2705182.1 cyclic nucleotide-binding domain-containing protein [Desulfobacula sp.]
MVKIEDLKRINLLKDIPDHLLGIIASEAQLSIFGTDIQLISPNEKVGTFYMLIMGQVAIKIELTPEIDVILDYIQSGSSFGTCALLKGSTASYSAVCQEPCEMITLSGERMLQLFEENHELAYHVMSGAAKQYKRRMGFRAQMITKTLGKNPELKEEIKDIKSIPFSDEKIHQLFEEDFQENFQKGYASMLEIVEIFRSRMEMNTREFLHSLAKHPGII